MITPRLHLDVLLCLIEFIDHPKDLIALALTARSLHAIIVPWHIDYRRISCTVSFEHVWKHLLDTPSACSRIRYLDIRFPNQIKIPRMCGIGSNLQTSSMRGRGYFLLALSKMINLKVFKFDTAGRITWGIPAVIEKMGCELEELEVHVKGMPSADSTAISSSQRHQISFFDDCLPSLRKYTIQGLGSSCVRSGFLQTLLGVNAANLTYMNVAFLPIEILSSGLWPDLQHLVFDSGNLLRQNAEIYIPCLRRFFCSHSKLITLSTDNIFLPGWAIESDDFLPNLKSLAITLRHGLPHEVSTITSHIAARLTHLQMTAPLCSYLKEYGVILPTLETCLYPMADLKLIQCLVYLIPNIKKLYVKFEHDWCSSRFPKAEDEIMLILFFASFKHLRVLLGPFDEIDTTDDNAYSLPKLLYTFPSLLYTRALNGSNVFEFLRLERDDIAKVMRYESEKVRPKECDQNSWGEFYQCNS